MSMRGSWDARATMHFVDTRRRDWNAAEFYAAGREEALDLLPPAFERLGFDPAGKRILEIGCGLGRLFPGHVELFKEAWGVDVSPEMLRQAEELCPVEARFLLGDGETLPVADSSIDYCFSYLVFHHLPTEDLAWGYFAEISRVLKPRGCFQVQLLASRPFAAKLVRWLPPLRRVWSRARGIPGDSRTWLGATIPQDRASRTASALGFADVETYPFGEHGTAYWIVGRSR